MVPPSILSHIYFDCLINIHIFFGRELSKKAQKANNVWWRLSGLLGDQNRLFMYILLQAMFTAATTALTVPIFLSYKMHIIFQIFKVSATVWNGGNFLLEVMPRQYIQKEKKKSETQQDKPGEVENTTAEEIVTSSDFPRSTHQDNEVYFGNTSQTKSPETLPSHI